MREEASWFHLGSLALTTLWSLEGSEALEAAEAPPLEALRGGPGGELGIEWLANGHVLMTGPVAASFTGELATL